MRAIESVDLFCGAGGTSQGLLMAANRLDRRLKLLAINHWSVAIDTHALNHAEAVNLCTGLNEVDPHKLVPSGRLDLLCASPECTHHSVARGGKPMDDQSRSSAWLILRWVQQIYIGVLIFENVPEWVSWGPLGANGKPLKSKKGELFRMFVETLKAMGYKVEWKILNCADYGSPTTRRRLFMIARRDGKAITWPAETHVSPAKVMVPCLFDAPRKPWRTAREIIDWGLKSRSIFGRKKPLADNTLKRIEAGMLKFNGIRVDLRKCMREGLRPYLIVPPGKTMEDAEAFLLPHRFKDGVHSIDEPYRTVTATSSDFSLVRPFLVDPNFGERKGQAPRMRSVDRPAPTVTSTGAGGVVQPLLMQIDHASGSGSMRPVDAPVATLVTKENTGLLEPFLTVLRGTGTVAGVDRPLPTVTASGTHYGAVEPFVVTVNHGDGLNRRVRSVDEPMATVTGSMGEGIAVPALLKFYGTGDGAVSVDEPVPTVTTKDRFGVMLPELIALGYGVYLLDIHFRMLQPRELARAQGFPDSYQFTGNREDVVKQIGNAVPPDVAAALCYEVLKGSGTKRMGVAA